VALGDNRDLEPLDPLDPMLAEPEAFAPLREERPSAPEPPSEPPSRQRRVRLRRRLVLAVVVVAVLAGSAALAQNLLDRRAARHAAATFSSFQVDDYVL